MEKKSEIKTVVIDTSNNNMLLLKTAGIGFLFGFVLEKSKVYDPSIIRDQMVFKRFIMLKMFLSALSASTLSVLIFRVKFAKAYANIFQLVSDNLKQRSMFTLIAGGLILGFGMTVGGSCPGMIFVQLGAGVSNAWVSVLGGILAAYVHGSFHDALNNVAKPSPNANKTFFEIFKVKPTFLHSVVAGILLSVVAIIEYLRPWRADFKIDSSQSAYSLTSAIWPPMFAGVILGSIQLLSFAFHKRQLGNSIPYTTIASYFLDKAKLEKNEYMKKFKTGNWDRMTFAIGVFSGSLLSSSLGGVYGKTSGVSLVSAFLGGFMLVFGARLADGCNTGHGISGTANMFFGAFVAMASMFAGGMGLALFL